MIGRAITLGLSAEGSVEKQNLNMWGGFGQLWPFKKGCAKKSWLKNAYQFYLMMIIHALNQGLSGNTSHSLCTPLKIYIYLLWLIFWDRTHKAGGFDTNWDGHHDGGVVGRGGQFPLIMHLVGGVFE